MYIVSSDWDKYECDTLERAYVKFIKLLHRKLIQYVEQYQYDFGYLDLGLWIEIRYAEGQIEYIMPQNIVNSLEGVNDIYAFLKTISVQNIEEKILGYHIKTFL